jgi:hypothetical protein
MPLQFSEVVEGSAGCRLGSEHCAVALLHSSRCSGRAHPDAAAHSTMPSRQVAATAPRPDTSDARLPAKSHNAQHSKNAKTVTLHYRWHPLCGATLRVLRQQKYGDRVCLICEGPSGTSCSFPSWMCSPESSGFTLGAPQISVEALVELRHLLDTLQVSSACDTASRISSSKEGADEKARGQAGSRTDKTAPARASSKRGHSGRQTTRTRMRTDGVTPQRRPRISPKRKRSRQRRQT